MNECKQYGGLRSESWQRYWNIKGLNRNASLHKRLLLFLLYMQGKVRILATGKGWKSGLNMNASSLQKRLEAVTY